MAAYNERINSGVCHLMAMMASQRVDSEANLLSAVVSGLALTQQFHEGQG
jgi:hypothetical protein